MTITLVLVITMINILNTDFEVKYFSKKSE